MPIDPTIYNRRSPIQPVDVEAILGPDPAQQSQRGSPALEASRILTLQKQQREQQLAMQYGDDPETFIRELSRVDPEKSESYRKTWLDALKTSAERHKADVENQRAHISLGVNLVQGATPNTWPAIRTAITAMSPDLAQLLPEQFDEQEIGKLIEIGRTSDQYLDAQAKAADLLASGKTQQAFWQGIAGTSNQAQLDAAKELAAKARLTPYLKMLGDRPWTPELQQEAVTKAMDPKDQYAAANPQAAAASSGGSDYAKFLASFAREKGKPVDQLTVAENVQAKKLFGQADDRPRISVNVGGQRPLTVGQALTQTRALRNDFNKETSAARTIESQLGLMRQSIKAVKSGAAPAGSQGVLVTFQKILDPTSVVRESEYARSASGLSILGRLEGVWMKMSQGGAGVTTKDLEQFVSLAEQFSVNQRQFAAESKQQIDAIADEYGLKKELITRDVGAVNDATQKTGPKEGDTKPIPGSTGGVAQLRGGRWIRIK